PGPCWKLQMLLGFQTLTPVVLLSSRSAGTTGPLPVAWFRSNRLPAGPGAGMVIPPPVLLSTTLRRTSLAVVVLPVRTIPGAGKLTARPLPKTVLPRTSQQLAEERLRPGAGQPIADSGSVQLPA